MRITKISLENFRSFKAMQSIELAPLTLLFGPNSVGKSSVLMALAYVQQILSKGHCDPQRLDALGHKAIGGFRALVHGQDVDRAIRIRLDFEPGETPFVHYDSGVEEKAYHVQAPYLLLEDLGGNIRVGAVELEVAWSERHKNAFVKNYRVWINEVYLGCISSSDDQKNTTIKELNTQHPLLIPTNNDEWLDLDQRDAGECVPLEVGDSQTELEFVMNQLNPNPANTAALADIEGAGESFINRVAPISVACQSGAIPILGMPVSTTLVGQEFDEAEEHFNFLVVRQLLSQAFVLPLDQILKYLESNIQIGPLRLVPDNDYIPSPHPEQSGWVDGSAAWDLLYKDPTSDESINRLVRNTSDWLSSSEKLDTGYEIVNRSLYESLEVDVKPNVGMLGLMSKRHVFFRELRTNILLSANQLGTGLSQVLPVIVASNYAQAGLVTVEQPELHIHPKFQVELADLFLCSREKHSFIIETHSEHLILRLLKRIRQSSENTLPEGVKSISEKDVSIVYLEPSESGVLVKHIRIDEGGEFVDRWPQGFFVERREELL
ncbi:AAA family ATPase [Pseudomonas frederiksbergensis]|uniref:AAA family ATPase n=1 Tax=Pseudomonas frederiksbergensis TaxID=104087 RepID=UPI003D979C6D